MTIKPCFAENAMIVSDDGARVTFHPVCPKCGRVMSNVTGSGHCSMASLDVAPQGFVNSALPSYACAFAIQIGVVLK